MANENMIKFLRGNVAGLPQTATAGALYFTKDEGIYMGMEDGSYHRYGDFIIVSDVNSLPTTGAHATCMYYCTSENILARYDAEKGWVQINKQPTAEEMKTLLGLGTLAYKSEVAEADLNTALAKKINDASAANHGHENKDVIDGITAEKVAAWDAAEQNAKDYADGLAENYAAAEHTHEIADVTGLQDALDGMQVKGDYSVEGHKHVKADITDFAHTHTSSEITDLDTTIKGYDYATKTELGDVDKKFADYKTAADQKVIDDEQDRRLGVLEGASATHATKDELAGVDAKFADYTKTADLPTDLGDFTNNAGYAKTVDVNAELDKKADKSVVDAMYTNANIDELIQGAKDYADANDADTKYGIVYDSDNKKIKLVEGGTDVEIDASAFIKDGMISNVTIGDDNDLVITFNTDAGKENIVLPLDQLVDIYTGVEGARIKVTVNSDKSISADLVAGSIGKDYLDDGVKASLALADSALQSHQDISHLATKEELNAAKTEAANQDAVVLSEAQAYADQSQADAEAKAAELDAALKTELQGEIDADVKVVSDALAQYKTDNDAAVALKANAADVYAKTETYTKAEVEALLTWSEF